MKKPTTKFARLLIVLACIFVPFVIGKLFPIIEEEGFYPIIWTTGVLFIAATIGSGMLLWVTFKFIFTGNI